MYKIASAEPVWLPLFKGVSAQFGPIGRKMVRAAYREMQAVLAEHKEASVEANDAFSASLIRQGLLQWKGIQGADGATLPFSPSGIETFLADDGLFLAAAKAYVTPWWAAQAEKNGLSGSGAGTSAAPTPAKPTARTAAKPARSAHTRSTPRKR